MTTFREVKIGQVESCVHNHGALAVAQAMLPDLFRVRVKSLLMGPSGQLSDETKGPLIASALTHLIRLRRLCGLLITTGKMKRALCLLDVVPVGFRAIFVSELEKKVDSVGGRSSVRTLLLITGTFASEGFTEVRHKHQ